MGNNTTAIPELLLKGEAVTAYYQNQLDLALCRLRDALDSVSRSAADACIGLKTAKEEEDLVQLEYLRPVAQALEICHKTVQEYYLIAKHSHDELRKLQEAKKKP